VTPIESANGQKEAKVTALELLILTFH
jgi:hypothetical protein